MNVSSQEPQVLEFSTLGLPNFSERSVLWFDDRLLLCRGEEEQEFQPTQDEWQRFWALVDRLGAWSWQPKYENPNVFDGESWRLVLQYGDKFLECSGNNAYPLGFLELRSAIERLLHK